MFIRYPVVAIFSVCFGIIFAIASKSPWYIDIAIIVGQYIAIATIIDIYKLKICLDSWYLKAKEDLKLREEKEKEKPKKGYDFRI